MPLIGPRVGNQMTTTKSEDNEVLRVAAGTPAQDLASAIAFACFEGNPPVLRAIGAAAVNQALKACAIARQFVGPRAMDLSIRPGFDTVTMPSRENPGETEEVSALVLKVLID